LRPDCSPRQPHRTAPARLAYLQGLLAPLNCKSGWHVADTASDASPDGVQDLLARMHWDADAVRDAPRTRTMPLGPIIAGS
jgi:hypothetical protein